MENKMGTTKPTKKYIIDKELRDALIGLILLLQLNSEKIYHHKTGRSSYRILKDTGEEIKLPFLYDLKRDLEELEEVIAEEEYDNRAEELLYYAKEIGLL